MQRNKELWPIARRKRDQLNRAISVQDMGKRGVTAETALLLAKIFKNSPQFGWGCKRTAISGTPRRRPARVGASAGARLSIDSVGCQANPWHGSVPPRGALTEKHEGSGAAEQDDSFEALLTSGARVRAGAVEPLLAAPPRQLLDGRLRIARRIGEGGMGVVYETHDERRRGTVALKTLKRLDAGNVYRLKNEFRSLADVSHPNLCRLHELFGEGEHWFFTMELVEGERFDHWVCLMGP